MSPPVRRGCVKQGRLGLLLPLAALAALERAGVELGAASGNLGEPADIPRVSLRFAFLRKFLME